MNAQTTQPIRILLIEDSQEDAELVLHGLRRGGITFISRHVHSEARLRDALQTFNPTVILSDFDLPGFNGHQALQIACELTPRVPFIFVSGKMGEERAIDALHRGAVDYVLKSNLPRLAPAVRRAVEEAARRRQHEAQITRLDRVLHMLSGVNGAVVRIRDRVELLRECCRLAVAVGGYAAVVAAAKIAGGPGIQPVAWQGADEQLAQLLRGICAESIRQPDSIAERAIRTGQTIARAAGDDRAAIPDLDTATAAGLSALIALPIVVDGTSVGVLLLAARDAQIVVEEELRMLQEVAGNLSFAWQYMQKDTKVRFLSHFDPHTGLAQRSLFLDRLGRRLTEAGAQHAHYAVMVLDIEHLGLINDSFGRRTGDLLLQHLVARLRRRYANTEQLAHFGGGTFALVEDLQTQRSSEELLDIIQARTADIAGEPFSIEKRDIPITVRVGLARHPQDGQEAETLLQHAEAALLHARAGGAGQMIYSAQRHSRRIGQLALEHRLHLALEREEFELYYQPKVNVITRRIQGVEALIRWHDPQAGLVSPAAFLPVAEAAGLGGDIGTWVIQRAARDCHGWMRAGLPPVRVAVNVSPSQLQSPDFTLRFIEAMRPWSNRAFGLDVEVTEAAFDENSDAEVQRLRLLRRSGVKIAIDDFGTGYSSLRRLGSLPVDTLKIDGSFISQISAQGAGKTVVMTIVALARGFGMTTIGEGVESQEQLDFLWQVGCDQSQGYLHSKAISRDEFAHLLQHGNGKLILPAESGDAEAPELSRASQDAAEPRPSPSEGLRP